MANVADFFLSIQASFLQKSANLAKEMQEPQQRRVVLDRLLQRYLKVLDSWQGEVNNIRLMHHEIWKESRVYRVIRQHRTGSRVERQTRILPRGQRTDVDYKFEVVGVKVHGTGSRNGMYWVPSQDSPAYGKVLVTPEYRSHILDAENYRDIFSEDAFRLLGDDTYLLLPEIFKENVVNISGFAYARKKVETKKSPSVAGDGAMNEYDIVPCLQMSVWPDSTKAWFSRGKAAAILNPTWKQTIREFPLFIVATGNPSSAESEEEFRLSFSLIEVETFRNMPVFARQLYGITKYAFKVIFEPIDYLDSYHVKTLFLWRLEQTSEDDLNCVSPVEFVRLMFLDMHRAVKEKVIPHFYAENSNIFPVHKLLENGYEKQSAYDENFAGIDTKIEEAFADLLQADLKLSVDPCEDEATAFESLSLLSSLDKKQEYIDAYLVRLLSVTTFSLYENQEQGTIASAVARISEVFRRYSERDVHIPRIIPMVNATLGRLAPGNEICIETTPTSGRDARDVFSTVVHHAFEAYIRGDTASARDLILNAVPPDDKRSPSGFGISITSYHKQFKFD